MKKTYLLFLEALQNALEDKKTNWGNEVSIDDWRALYRLSTIHDVVPLFAHTVYQCDSLVRNPKYKSMFLSQARTITIKQALKSASFAVLYQEMLKENLKPLVMKGIICRSLYPEPEQRPSFDEDLLIFPWQIQKYHLFFKSHGFDLVNSDIDIEKVDEISYQNKKLALYLEVHKYLFPSRSSAFGDLNSLFNILEDRQNELIYGTAFRTFGYTDHLLYIICHAYKHFLYSGFGIRQICDILMFTKSYGNLIDWERIYESCRIFRMDRFLIAIFRICEKYLGLNRNNYAYKEIWSDDINEESLLLDILSGGLYGAADEDRLHSSTMTLEVVSAQNEGRKARSLVKVLFPGLDYIKQKYPYLKRKKWLLPIAWIQRGFDYLERKHKRGISPSKTIEIGNNRVKILREYHIID